MALGFALVPAVAWGAGDAGLRGVQQNQLQQQQQQDALQLRMRQESEQQLQRLDDALRQKK